MVALKAEEHSRNNHPQVSPLDSHAQKNRTKLSTKDLYGKRVLGGKKLKKIGKVRSFVFHPSERRLIGLLVKRPDAALMFHRQDLFVALNGFALVDDELHIHDRPDASGNSAISALGLNWAHCVLWVGMPLVSESGCFMGYVHDVCFDAQTGRVLSLVPESGLANDIILGRRTIDASFILGFKRANLAAKGDVKDDCSLTRASALSRADFVGASKDLSATEISTETAALRDPNDQRFSQGYILLSDAAEEQVTEGGAAELAGKAASQVSTKAKSGAAKIQPKVKVVAEKTERVVDDGAYALGKQLGKTKGMFAAFKDEYKKALNDGTDD